jgi:hypothetical protein
MAAVKSVEDMTMRKTCFALMLALGLAIGNALRPPSAAAQAEFQPFTIGESVRLTVENFPSGTSITCRVTSVSNDFIHCASDGQRRPRAINLRYVQEIAPIPDR